MVLNTVAKRGNQHPFSGALWNIGLVAFLQSQITGYEMMHGTQNTSERIHDGILQQPFIIST